MYHIPLKTRIRIKVRNFLAKWGNKLLLVWDIAVLTYSTFLILGTVLGRAYPQLALYTIWDAIMIGITYKQVKNVRR